MYVYELFRDRPADEYPDLPINDGDKILFGLNTVENSADPLTWGAVCSVILSRGAFRTVSQRIDTGIAATTETALKFVIHSVAVANSSTYHAMRAAFDSEYNPIENYDLTEQRDNTHNSTRTVEHEQTTDTTHITTDSAVTDSTTTPEFAVTTKHGATTDTRRDSAAIDSRTTAEHTDTTTDERQTVGYDKPTEYTNAEKTTRTATAAPITDTTNTGERTQTTTGAEYTDTQTTDGITATSNLGERTRTETQHDGTTTDTDTDNGDEHETLTRHGNIGVTTTQQMLTSEIELKSKLNLAQTIAQDILNQIAIANYWIYGGDNNACI